MATQILGGFQRDRRSTWGLGLPALLLSSSFPPSPWPPGCMAHRYGLIGLLGMGRRGLGKLAPRGGGGIGRMEGGRLSSGLTCGPGAPPWNPPLVARSRCVVQTPLPGEETRKTTVRRKGRCSGKDGGDKGGRAKTIGHFQGLWPHAGPLGCSLDGRLTGKHLPFYFM